jgi:hypothetical protein
MTQMPTTVSQDARSRDTVGILDQMPDPQSAAQSLDRLMELSPEMRGGAILDSEVTLAASGELTEWGEAAGQLLSAAAEDEPFEQIHVATEAGEVFAVREGSLTAVSVTERFVLASLMAFDMRATLRDLAAGAANGAQEGKA